jgi:hypothetical protein
MANWHWTAAPAGLVSLLLYMLGQWDQAAHYNLEPPLVAPALGLLVSNTPVNPSNAGTAGS